MRSTFVAASILFSGCSAHEKAVNSLSPRPGDEALVNAASESGGDSAESREVPIDVSIGHAFEDADNLNVKVLLKAKTDLDPTAVAVSLIGLHEGEIRQQDTKILSDEFSGKTFESGTTLAVLFRLNRSDLTEYQIKVGWGSDAAELASAIMGKEGKPAESAMARSSLQAPLSDQAGSDRQNSAEINTAGAASQIRDGAETPGSGRLTLDDQKTDQTVIGCQNPPCDRRYVVTAELVNGTSETINGVSLGLGLYWVENSGSLVTPADGDPLSKNEELINLASVVLAPGNRRKVRVTVDRPIPVVPGGEFHAHLRLVSSAATN